MSDARQDHQFVIGRKDVSVPSPVKPFCMTPTMCIDFYSEVLPLQITFIVGVLETQ